MDPRTFLDVASDLATGGREADWRSSISRAYYAAFHVGCRLLAESGFAVPDGPQAHAYLWLRLSNASNPVVIDVGRSLANLRKARNVADYDLEREILESAAHDQVYEAMQTIRVLDDLAGTPAILTEVIEAIRDYERTVLREVTWRGP